MHFFAFWLLMHALEAFEPTNGKLLVSGETILQFVFATGSNWTAPFPACCRLGFQYKR